MYVKWSKTIKNIGAILIHLLFKGTFINYFTDIGVGEGFQIGQTIFEEWQKQKLSFLWRGLTDLKNKIALAQV